MVEVYAGLDVSDKLTHVCVSASDGAVLWSGACATDPEVIAKTLRSRAPGLVRVILETGPLSAFLYHGLAERGAPVICVCARHAKGVLSVRVNKSDPGDYRLGRRGIGCTERGSGRVWKEMMKTSVRVSWRIGGMAIILLSALVFLISGRSGGMSWLAMFGVMAGVYIMRLGFAPPTDAPYRRLPTKWAAVGIALVAAMASSFGWLFFSASIGRYSPIDLWLCAASTIILMGYLFLLFFINRNN